MKKIGIVFITLMAIIAGLSSCSESAKEKTERIARDSIHHYDSLFKLRQEIYGIAVSTIKGMLKEPLTAQFPSIVAESDIIKMQSTDSKIWVVFPYDMQIQRGKYMHYYASVLLYKTNSKWVAETDDFRVSIDAPSAEYWAFDENAGFMLGTRAID